MSFFSRKRDGLPVPFTNILNARRAVHLVLPQHPGEAIAVLGMVRQWPALFGSMQMIANGWDLPLLRCAQMEGQPRWTACCREVSWQHGSLIIDLNRKRPKALPQYPAKAALVCLGEGSNLDLTPPPRQAAELLRELARLAGLPFDGGQPPLSLPAGALDAARRQLRPAAKNHVLLHLGRGARKKTTLEVVRFIMQGTSAAVYVSGTPAWKHDIPELHYVHPGSLLELLALASVCHAALLTDERLGKLPAQVVPGVLLPTPDELANPSLRNALRPRLLAAANTMKS